MAGRIILCSSCGTKNYHWGACNECGRQLQLSSSLLSALSRLRWGRIFLATLLATIGLAYFTPATIESSFSKLVADSGQGFTEPPVSVLPGLVEAPVQRGVSPLTIKSRRGVDYFVKLVVPFSRNEVMSFYVRGGQPLTVKVPLGTYELKYAAGSKWYGQKYKFGPDTIYSRANETFRFEAKETYDGITYSGWTVELILQTGGNLRTQRIDASDF